MCVCVFVWMCRFINKEDIDWFNETMLQLVTSKLSRAHRDMVEKAPLVFCSFMRYKICYGQLIDFIAKNQLLNHFFFY